jgi:hypothetical protein
VSLAALEAAFDPRPPLAALDGSEEPPAPRPLLDAVVDLCERAVVHGLGDDALRGALLWLVGAGTIRLVKPALLSDRELGVAVEVLQLRIAEETARVRELLGEREVRRGLP